MSRITFFIGNGFDINVGLNTKYKEFYAYYIKKCPEDMLAKSIWKNYQNWSDLELGLGRYTEKIKIEDAEAFWKSEANLERELAAYLKAQMGRVNISDEKRESEISAEMRRSLTEFTEELPEYFRHHIEKELYNINEHITYSFVSFNYTDVFDKCLNAARKILKGQIGGHFDSNGLLYYDIIGDLLHIHGTTDKEMVLGVNDDEQVANKEFIKNNLYRQYIIKEETNKRYNNDKIEKVCRIISESIVICVFGMSIGETDRVWWRHLCRWLGNDRNRRLIIYANVTQVGKHTLFARENEVRRSLKENAEIPREMWEQIKSQVYVNCDTRIFCFNILDN